MATPSSILAWKILMDRGAWRDTVHGVAKSCTLLSNRLISTAQGIQKCNFSKDDIFHFCCVSFFFLQDF